MDKKQVIVVALLVVAIVLSAASVMMNVSVINDVDIQEAPASPGFGEVSVTVLETPQNTGGNANELG